MDEVKKPREAKKVEGARYECAFCHAQYVDVPYKGYDREDDPIEKCTGCGCDMIIEIGTEPPEWWVRNLM